MAVQVEFQKSGKTTTWDDSHESILELAEANGIEIDTECEAGMCGTCKIRLLSGKVDMETEDGLDEDDIKQNMILVCVAIPVTDIVLDA
ncbi:MAG: 2Fe-2S iron-sulfur cluster binding domain-containing protein [Desulfobacteraceae bacterium]|nr:2Fe-2S iron-sulfur cluster binding domain-containing protein [Desulfobacteraceae bacterium]MCF8095174.1 2Fe-2S iron-sulfur cluster binding domain-containing protein [Desulfobacteraceae bacterium]